MPGSYDPQTALQRVLLLERQQGFTNRAAVGGLEAFAGQQVVRAGDAVAPGLRRAAAALAGYADLSRHGRETAVASALHALLTGVGRETPSCAPKEQSVDARAPLTPQPPLPQGERGSPKRGLRTQRVPGGTRQGEGGSGAPPRGAPAGIRRVRPGSLPFEADDRLEGTGPAIKAAPPKLHIVHRTEDLTNPIDCVKGMRQSTAEALKHLGVATIRDLLYFFPRTHYDYTDTRSISRLRMGQKTTLVGTIVDVRQNRTARGVHITTAVISDDSGTIGVRWFNQPYLAKNLPRGARVAITGEPDVFNERLTFTPRDWEIIKSDELTHGARLVPMYSLTRGLFQRSLRTLMKRVVEEYAAAVEDFLAVDLRDQLHLPSLPEAIASYHFPIDEEQKSWAEQRLAFDELFLIQIGLLLRKRRLQQPVPGIAVAIDQELLQRFCASLPFELTGAQRRVMREILEDMSRPVPMNRLLQGDVGSGKTVVAAAALLQVVHDGRQGLLMAPTEILAEQHFATLQALLEPLGVRCELLIGSTPKAKRRGILEGAMDGTVQVLVGTHALIQGGIELQRVGLAITDEQHRFGVEQRSLLRQKGLCPHVLAMTATPIPRTLAMTLYGDLDVSSIDEMPPGRLPVVTTWARRASEAYGVVRDEVRHGHQAFIICPVIEESAEQDMRSVIAEHKELQSIVFRDLKVGLLHGRLKPGEKDAVLSAFRRGEYHILVATSVVEVGIDIPNATVMVIRDAHRFGLAQLHQFRGRVGRGGDQAYCVLLSDSEGENASERLEALTALDNGFELAEEDLRLRGPGEFWGTRQSGLPELRVAQLGDVATIELARDAAIEVLRRDPELSSEEHAQLRQEVNRFWAQAVEIS